MVLGFPLSIIIEEIEELEDLNVVEENLMITIDQSETSVQVTWSLSVN